MHAFFTPFEAHQEPTITIKQAVTHWLFLQVLKEIGISHLEEREREEGGDEIL